jgi:predicted nucleic acid-binding protein
LSLPRIPKRLPDPNANRRWIVQLIQAQTQMIFVPPHECQVVTGDPEDDYVLAATRLSSVDYLVTGDRQLLCLKRFGLAPLVSSCDFITILASQPSQ